jgi:hypothetical protein
MTEKEFVDKVCAASAGVQLVTHYDVATTALSVAKEAGAKFTAEFPEAIALDVYGSGFHARGATCVLLSNKQREEVCRRYNDRGHVMKLLADSLYYIDRIRDTVRGSDPGDRTGARTIGDVIRGKLAQEPNS